MAERPAATDTEPRSSLGSGDIRHDCPELTGSGSPSSREPVELPISHAAEESAPFARCKPEHRTADVPAVADTDAAVRQASYFDAVTVGEAQGAFHPVKT